MVTYQFFLQTPSITVEAITITVVRSILFVRRATIGPRCLIYRRRGLLSLVVVVLGFGTGSRPRGTPAGVHVDMSKLIIVVTEA